MAIVSEYMVIPHQDRLPSTTTHSDSSTTPRAISDIAFDLPSGIKESNAVLSFVFNAEPGHDDSIDVAFTISGGHPSWKFGYRQHDGTGATSLVLPVTVHGGHNTFRITLDKGGSIQTTEETVDMGGKGRVDFFAFVLWYRLSQ